MFLTARTDTVTRYSSSSNSLQSQTTCIDFIRHGEPVGGNVFRGRVDLALTAFGQQQFQARIALHQQPWQHIISSPLQRCASSAQWLAAQQRIPCELVSGWQEIDYGDWENKPVDDVFAQHPQQAKKIWQQPLAFCAPNGEAVVDFQRRIVAAWDNLLASYAGQHVLVVTHGGVMRVLSQYLLKLEPQAMNRLAIPYAGLMRFKVDSTTTTTKTTTAENDAQTEQWVTLLAMDGEALSVTRTQQILAQTRVS